MVPAARPRQGRRRHLQRGACGAPGGGGGRFSPEDLGFGHSGSRLGLFREEGDPSNNGRHVEHFHQKILVRRIFAWSTRYGFDKKLIVGRSPESLRLTADCTSVVFRRGLRFDLDPRTPRRCSRPSSPSSTRGDRRTTSCARQGARGGEGPAIRVRTSERGRAPGGRVPDGSTKLREVSVGVGRGRSPTRSCEPPAFRISRGLGEASVEDFEAAEDSDGQELGAAEERSRVLALSFSKAGPDRQARSPAPPQKGKWQESKEIFRQTKPEDCEVQGC